MGLPQGLVGPKKGKIKAYKKKLRKFFFKNSIFFLKITKSLRKIKKIIMMHICELAKKYH